MPTLMGRSPEFEWELPPVSPEFHSSTPTVQCRESLAQPEKIRWCKRAYLCVATRRFVTEPLHKSGRRFDPADRTQFMIEYRLCVVNCFHLGKIPASCDAFHGYRNVVDMRMRIARRSAHERECWRLYLAKPLGSRDCVADIRKHDGACVQSGVWAHGSIHAERPAVCSYATVGSALARFRNSPTPAGV